MDMDFCPCTFGIFGKLKPHFFSASAASVPAGSQTKSKGTKGGSSPHTSAPKPVPLGRRKRSSLSASSSSPTSPKSASGPRATPPCSPLASSSAQSPGAKKPETTGPKVVKAGKQAKPKKADFKLADHQQVTLPSAALSETKPAHESSPMSPKVATLPVGAAATASVCLKAAGVVPVGAKPGKDESLAPAEPNLIKDADPAAAFPQCITPSPVKGKQEKGTATAPVKSETIAPTSAKVVLASVEAKPEKFEATTSTSVEVEPTKIEGPTSASPKGTIAAPWKTKQEKGAGRSSVKPDKAVSAKNVVPAPVEAKLVKDEAAAPAPSPVDVMQAKGPAPVSTKHVVPAPVPAKLVKGEAAAPAPSPVSVIQVKGAAPVSAKDADPAPVEAKLMKGEAVVPAPSPVDMMQLKGAAPAPVSTKVAIPASVIAKPLEGAAPTSLSPKATVASEAFKVVSKSVAHKPKSYSEVVACCPPKVTELPKVVHEAPVAPKESEVPKTPAIVIETPKSADVPKAAPQAKPVPALSPEQKAKSTPAASSKGNAEAKKKPILAPSTVVAAATQSSISLLEEDDDLPPLIPPEKPVTMPVFQPQPVAEAAPKVDPLVKAVVPPAGPKASVTPAKSQPDSTPIKAPSKPEPVVKNDKGISLSVCLSFCTFVLWV